MNNIYSCVPINGTAARVTGQKGCYDTLTEDQERVSIIDRAAQIENEMKVFKKNDPKRKALGLEKLALQDRLRELNLKVKNIRIASHHRDDFCDCVFFIMKEQLSAFQYKQIMRLARELHTKDTKDKELLND